MASRALSMALRRAGAMPVARAPILSTSSMVGRRHISASPVARGGDGHQHYMFEPESYNMLGAPLVIFLLVVPGGISIVLYAQHTQQKKFLPAE